MNNMTSKINVYDVVPLQVPPRCTAVVPGSKSITNRALIMAALAQKSASDEYSTLTGALRSEDTEVMIDSLQRLGIAVEADWNHCSLQIPCIPIAQWKTQADFFCGNSGTTIRFLTAMLCAGTGHYRLDGVARMRQRPIADLLSALEQLHVSAQSELGNGCPPVLLRTHGLPGGTVTIRSDVSSQFLSALLMAAPYATQPLTLMVEGTLVSEPYIDMTLAMMQQWGVAVERPRPGAYRVEPQTYRALQYPVEPDASSASYFWAAAAITGGTVTVPGLENSLQGDVGFCDALVQMGCQLDNNDTITGGKLHGIDIDMNAISDTVMTLAAVALFAEGTTTIRNVAHVRHKETDRLTAIATELRKVGAMVEERTDGLTIHPQPLHGAVLDTYDDHRMAMSLALIGLRIPGIRINDPGCTAKTFPTYWRSLENLRQ
jgi:3-phosphoshikimate 1-carboxyvinyltransferase